jgi:hypothetical protein
MMAVCRMQASDGRGPVGYRAIACQQQYTILAAELFDSIQCGLSRMLPPGLTTTLTRACYVGRTDRYIGMADISLPQFQAARFGHGRRRVAGLDTMITKRLVDSVARVE